MSASKIIDNRLEESWKSFIAEMNKFREQTLQTPFHDISYKNDKLKVSIELDPLKLDYFDREDICSIGFEDLMGIIDSLNKVDNSIITTNKHHPDDILETKDLEQFMKQR